MLVITNVLPSSPIFSTLIMEAILSSEMSVLTNARRHHIPEDIALAFSPQANYADRATAEADEFSADFCR
jgi:hypothetical protein